MSGLLVSVCKLAWDRGDVAANPVDRPGVVDGWCVTASLRPIKVQICRNHTDSTFHTWRRQRALIYNNGHERKLFLFLCFIFAAHTMLVLFVLDCFWFELMYQNLGFMYFRLK